MTERSKPLVSIVTPTFNSAQFLPRMLKCIDDQTYHPVEHIVVDGGSTDGTLDILRERKHTKWISGPDNGMYDAVNKGLKIAAGSILAYLNSDDLYFDDTIARVVDFFADNEDVDLAYSNLRYIDEHENEIFVRKYPPFSWKMFAVLDGSTVPQQAAFWRRRVLDNTGGFDSTFRMAGDFEFFIRAGKTCTIRKIAGPPLAQFRFHGEMQTLNKLELNNREIDRIHAMYGFPPTAANRALKLTAKVRYKMWNLHRLRDKSANLLTGTEPKYRP